MSNVTDAVSSMSGTPTASTQAKTPGDNSVLGKDDFLKLFATQLTNQDPMNPMQDQDFMGQMAQFSTLEQISNMASSQSLTQTVGLIGKTVTYTDSKTAQTHSGVVEKVTRSGDTTSLTVDGTAGVDPTTITQIA